MNRPHILLLSLLITFGASAAPTPIKLLTGELKDIKANAQAVKKWNCSNYRDNFSNYSCEYLKAYSYHTERKFDEAHGHINALYNSMVQNADIAKFGGSPDMLTHMIEGVVGMYKNSLADFETGGLNEMSVDNLMQMLSSDDQLDGAYGAAIFTSKLIDIFYRDGSMQSMNHFYSHLHESLEDLYLSQAKVNSDTIPRVYNSILSKMTLYVDDNERHLNNLQMLRSKITPSEKDKNLDILIDTYLSSLSSDLSFYTFNKAISHVDESKTNSDDIKIRLFVIYMGALSRTIPESKMMPTGNDFSKVRMRYYQLLSPANQQRFKESILSATELVLQKPSHSSSIDEIVVASYVTHRDLFQAPKRKESYYLKMEKRYSVLMKDYVDFTDQTSDEYSAANRVGMLNRQGVLGEGLM